MKKLVIAVMLVLLVGAFAMALDATVTGDATLTWGMDFGNNATGFTNAATATISIPLVAKTSDSKTGDAPAGEITLSDFSASISGSGLAVAAPTITAKLQLSDASYLTIFGAPSYGAGLASDFFTLLNTRDEDTKAADAVSFDLSAYNGGFTFGYDLGMGVLSLSVVSAGNWDSVAAGTDMTTDGKVYVAGADGVDIDADDTATYYGVGASQAFGPWGAGDTIPVGVTYIVVKKPSSGTPANTLNDYAATLGLVLTPMDMLSVTLKANLDASKDVVASVKASVKPMDMLGFWVATDVSMPKGGDLAYDLAGGAKVSLDKLASFGTTLYYAARVLDLQVTTDLLAVENLTFGNVFEAYLGVAPMEYADSVNVAYDLGGIKPYASFTTYVETATTYAVDAGVSFSKVLANTVFTIDYATKDLNADKGDLELSAKVSY